MNFFELPFDIKFDLDEFMSHPEVKSALLVTTFSLPLISRDCLRNETIEILEDKFEAKINRFRMFIYPPMFITGIHIDGVPGAPTRYALNIPIANCKGTKTIFYKEKSNLEQAPVSMSWAKDNSYSIPFDIRDLECITGELELDKPTVINPSVPHNVYSPIGQQRSILSFRFTNFAKPIEYFYEKFHNT
jgi:hypothetical protein